MTWAPIFALPNIELREALGNEHVALVPWDDARFKALRREHSLFRTFAARFTDTFRHRINPAFLLRFETPESPASHREPEFLTSFRDILSISVVAKQKAAVIENNAQHRPLFSDYFSFYPWQMSNDFRYVIASTPNMWALHDPNQFRGQHAPNLSRMAISTTYFDMRLYEALMDQWWQRFIVGDNSHRLVALFRSLDTAYQAMLMPGGETATFSYLDIGRSISIWISAFEILLHPGGDGEIRISSVLDHIESIRWQDQRLTPMDRRTSRGRPTNIAGWIYEQMYQCRNNFLHGNPVTPANLQIAGSQRPLFMVAPVLYWAMLLHFLELDVAPTYSAPQNDDEISQQHTQTYQHFASLRSIESALLASLLTEAQHEEQRRQRVARAQRG